MKVILRARNSNRRVIVPILDEDKNEFLRLFHSSRVDALSVIMDGADFYRAGLTDLGILPRFISVDTAKRLDSFFTSKTSLSGSCNHLFRLEYLLL